MADRLGAHACVLCQRPRRATATLEQLVREAVNGLPAAEDLNARHEELFRRVFPLTAELSGVCQGCAAEQLTDVLRRSRRPIAGVPLEGANG
jgi:hypothetical protein